MSKNHMESNTQYVDEHRAPTDDERKAIDAALVAFGARNDLGKNAILVGRQDEPYGWYLFDLGDCLNDGKRRYLILGDCLDVLDDFAKLLTLKDLHEFALREDDGRYDALQEWGLFKGISTELWNKAILAGVSFESRYIAWDEESAEWKLYYHVRWKVCEGLHGNTAIRITATNFSHEYADKAFIADFENVSVTEDSAKNIVARLKGEKSPVAKMIKEAWVLTIIDAEGKVYPEIHLQFAPCVDRVIEELKSHTSSFDAYDVPAIQDELRNQMYWEDPMTGFKFDLVLCPVCD